MMAGWSCRWPTAGVRPRAANPSYGTAPGLWPRLWHITGVGPGPRYPSYVPSPGCGSCGVRVGRRRGHRPVSWQNRSSLAAAAACRSGRVPMLAPVAATHARPRLLAGADRQPITTPAWGPGCRQDGPGNDSFGPSLSPGQALMIIGTPATATQLTQKEPHPWHITGVTREPACRKSPPPPIQQQPGTGEGGLRRLLSLGSGFASDCPAGAPMPEAHRRRRTC